MISRTVSGSRENVDGHSLQVRSKRANVVVAVLIGDAAFEQMFRMIGCRNPIEPSPIHSIPMKKG